MSKTVDERVVSMQFDNSRFEKNVSTTMSTLEKLKQKLNFTGASKGLNDIGTAAKNVNMNGLGSAVETVQAKFSALQVVGMTALANITNSAVNTGKRMISAFTIDPIKTGFSEYETQINAVQTILANTQSKGTTIDDVNSALDTLNEYADKTIYNFTEMTRNIGTFTAAGVDLQTSIDSIQGIANLAAVSGSTSQQASTAMYQLSQALAAGKVSLMDWNSVVNAGMGGELFQNALIRTSELLKTGAKDAIATYGSFRESLTKGEWLTTEVLTETLKQISGAYSKADLIAQGFTEKQAEEITQLAETASSAATDVKTFTQLWDTLKESAQSGWTSTWEMLVGDFEESKKTLSELSKFLGGFIDAMSDARNTFLGGAIDPSGTWSKIADKLNNSGLGKLKDAAESIANVTHSLEEFQDITSKVWRGDFGNGQERFALLDKAGYDHRVVQDLVNKGNDYKITVDDIEASHKKFGLTMNKNTKSTKEVSDALDGLSDKQLREADLTEAEIKLYHDLAEEAERTGVSISTLVDEMSKADGRTMIIDSLKNAGSGLVGVFKALKDAWVEIFPPMSSVRLYGIIKSINEFSKSLRATNERTENLKRTFKGIFALIDIIATVAGGAFRIGFEILRSVLGYFGMDVLDLTANLGDFLVKLRDGFESMFDVTKLLDKIIPTIKEVAGGISDWFKSLKESDNLPRDIILGLANGLTKGAKLVWTAIVELATGLIEKFRNAIKSNSPSKEFMAIGNDIILGLIIGIKDKASKVIDFIKTVALNIVDFFKNLDFGTALAGGSLIASIFIGNKVANALNAFSAPFEGLGDVLSGTGEILEKAAKPIKKILTNTAKVVKSFANVMNAYAFSMNADAIKDIAISIGILVGAVLALIHFAGDDYTKIWNAVGVIAALSIVLGILAFAMSKMSETSATISKEGISIDGIKTSLLSIAASVLLLAIVVKMIGELKPEQAIQGFIGLAGILAAILGVLYIYGKFVKGKAAQNIDKAGKMLGKLALTMLVLVGVAKIVGSMKWSELKKAGAGLVGLSVVIAGLILATKLAGKNIDKTGSMLFKLGVAMMLLVLVGKIIAGMSWKELAKAGIGIGALSLIVSGLMFATKFAGKDATKLGSTMLAISAAMLILAFVCKTIAGMSWGELRKAGVGIIALTGVVIGLIAATKLANKDMPKIATTILGIGVAMALLAVVARIIAGMTWGEMLKAGVGIAALAGIVAGLIAATKLAGSDIDKVGSTILKIGLAIGILAAIATLLGFLPIEHLAKGIIAVGILGAIMALLIKSTKGASNCMANLIVMTVAIGVMTAAVVGLSFIDPAKLLPAAAALALLMGMFAVMEAASSIAKSAVGSAIIMTVVVGLLAGVLYLLSELPIEASIGTAAALSILMLAMSASMVLISKLGVMSPMAMASVAVMTVVVGALAGILWLVQDMPVESTIGIVASLSTLLLSMSAALAILAVVGLAGPAAFIGLGALATLIVGIGGIIAGIGALQQYVVDLEGFIDTAIPILEKIGIALGSFFGNIIDSFADAATQSLPDIGQRLSDFMTNVTPFIEGVKMVDSNTFKNVGILAASIVALTAADLVSGIMSFLQGGSSLAKLGADLSAFMTNATPFITGASLLDANMLQGVNALAETILILTKANVLDGLTSWLTGGSSLAAFSEQLPVLGTHLSAFAANLGSFDNTKIATVTCAAEAIKVMAHAANEIPNEGGWLAKLLGDNSIETFGGYLPGLATNIGAFAANLGTFTSEQVSTVKCAADAILQMAKAANEIPNEGGWLADLLGDNSVETFGGYLPGLATNLKNFAANLGTFTSEQVSTVKCAADAILQMAKAANEIPNEGGWLAKLLGDNSIETFGGYLPGLGTNLKNFAANLGTFTADQVSTIKCALDAIAKMAEVSGEIDGQAEWAKKLFGDNSLSAFGSGMASLGSNLNKFASNLGTFTNEQVQTVKHAISAINAFSDLANSDLGSAKKNLEGFGEKMVGLGSDIKSFVGGLPSSAGIAMAISDIRDIIKLVKDTAAVDANAASKFTNALKELGNNGVKSFVEAFTNSASVDKVKKAAAALVNKAIEGAKTKLEPFKTALKTIASDGAKAVSDKKSSFYSAGSSLVDGLKNGISENSYKVTAQARAMAKAAAQAAEEELDINSPSKVFRKIGTSIPEGFAMGIEKLSGMVTNSSTAMAETSVDTVRSSISRLADIINTDIDSQPTIRPVLDLSDVKSRAGTIGDMIDSGFSVDAVAHVGAINSSMNRRIQNGDNFEVVHAIDKLRKEMANTDRASYNINGISYSEGSEVSDAIKTLVRHAKIEGRT